MSAETLAKQIDLVVMTGSVPFITAGLLQGDSTEATLISGALSGMSNLFQEMLKQGGLRHSELYNAHVYIRHLIQMNDTQGLVRPEIKQGAQMSVALIVRESELTREQEIALSELCYSIMLKICERPDLAKKLTEGNIEGYAPTSWETRMILAEAFDDYRRRAKKSIFYENPHFLQEKDRFLLIPTNNKVLEKRIREFCEWIKEKYYPSFIPKIDFKNFFGKREYWSSISHLKENFKNRYEDNLFREEVRTALFQFILEAGLMPLVLYSENILDRIEKIFERELSEVFDHFLTNLLLVRGPVGISLRSIEENLSRLEVNDPRKTGWTFLKSFLTNIGDRPFELPFLQQLCNLLELFDFSENFLQKMYDSIDSSIVPQEYIEEFFSIVCSHLSKPTELSKIIDEPAQIEPVPSVGDYGIPTPPSHAARISEEEDSFVEYLQLKNLLTEEFKTVISSIAIPEEERVATEKDREFAKREMDIEELFNELLELIDKVDMEILEGSYGILVKRKFNRIRELIRDKDLEEAFNSLVDLLETFDALEMTDTPLFSFLSTINETIQKILSPKELKESEAEKEEVKVDSIITDGEISKLISKFLDLLSDESYSQLLKEIERNPDLFGDKIDELKGQIGKLIDLKSDLKKSEKSVKKDDAKGMSKSSKEGKTDDSKRAKSKDQESKKKAVISLPKASVESSRLNDELLVHSISDTFSWIHDHLYGRFFFTKKYLPFMPKRGLFFSNVAESLIVELGLMIDIIQCFTDPRTMLISHLRRIIDTVAEKIEIFSPSSGVKYLPEESLTINVQHVGPEFKKIAEKIIEIISQIEADAVAGVITEENKRAYLDSKLLGRAQQKSIPYVQKLLSELKTKNKSLSKVELEKLSKATNVNFKEITTNIVPLQKLSEPILTKESEYNKEMREIINRFKKWQLDISNSIGAVFRVCPEISDPSEPMIHERVIPSIIRLALSDNINKKFDAMAKSDRERREFIDFSFKIKREIYSLAGMRVIEEGPLKQIFKLDLVKPDGSENYLVPFSSITPSYLSDELKSYFALSERNNNIIEGRVLPYQPFNEEDPSTLGGLILSDAFRRAFASVQGGIEKILKIGENIHGGMPNLMGQLMESYKLICMKCSY